MATRTDKQHIKLTSNKASASITILDMLALALVSSFELASRLLVLHAQRPFLC